MVTDRLAMTLAVDRAVKPQHTHTQIIFNNVSSDETVI